MVTKPLFYVGMHQPSDAGKVDKCIVSVNRLEKRRSDFPVQDWILDSGAFTRITLGKGHMPVREYARQIDRWSKCGNLQAAVAQDWMCEPFVLGITGKTVKEHQMLTWRAYNDLRKIVQTTHVMPVLQGFEPDEYVDHIRQYGPELLTEGMWVGVGSVCKRNGSPRDVEAVLAAIKDVRPDLRLHGFGIKLTSLAYQRVSEGFYSTDSMAWSYSARKKGRNGNDPSEAVNYVNRIANQPVQMAMFGG